MNVDDEAEEERISEKPIEDMFEEDFNNSLRAGYLNGLFESAENLAKKGELMSQKCNIILNWAKKRGGLDKESNERLGEIIKKGVDNSISRINNELYIEGDLDAKKDYAELLFREFKKEKKALKKITQDKKILSCVNKELKKIASDEIDEFLEYCNGLDDNMPDEGDESSGYASAEKKRSINKTVTTDIPRIYYLCLNSKNLGKWNFLKKELEKSTITGYYADYILSEAYDLELEIDNLHIFLERVFPKPTNKLRKKMHDLSSKISALEAMELSVIDDGFGLVDNVNIDNNTARANPKLAENLKRLDDLSKESKEYVQELEKIINDEIKKDSRKGIGLLNYIANPKNNFFLDEHSEYYSKAHKTVISDRGDYREKTIKLGLDKINLAVKISAYKKTGQIESYFYDILGKSKHEKFDVPDIIGRGTSMGVDVMVTGYKNCENLGWIAEGEKVDKKQFYSIVGSVVAATKDIHQNLQTIVESNPKLKKTLEKENHRELLGFKIKEKEIFKGMNFKPIFDYLEGYKNEEIWIKDIKPANWGYNLETGRLVVFDFDYVAKRLPHEDWCRFIDNEALNGYDRDVMLEMFLDSNSSAEEKEKNRKLYYYSAFKKNYRSVLHFESLRNSEIALHRLGRMEDALDHIIKYDSKLAPLKEDLRKLYYTVGQS